MSELRKIIKAFQRSDIPDKNEKMLEALQQTAKRVHEEVALVDADEDAEFEDVLEQEFGTAEIAAKPQFRGIVLKTQKYFVGLLKQYL